MKDVEKGKKSISDKPAGKRKPKKKKPAVKATQKKPERIEKKENRQNREIHKNQESREEYIRRREEERARKRARRRRKVLIQKIAIAASVVLILCGIGCIVLLNQESFRLSRKMSAGSKYTEDGDYEKAQTAYEEALKIDPATVEAYRCLAQNNLDQDDINAAKEILYTGWETTQDDSLLHYYCVITLNEVVREINNKNCNTETMDKCFHVLEYESENADAVSLLKTCYDRLYAGKNDENTSVLFMDADASADTCQYNIYEQQVRKMLELYEKSPSEGLRAVLARYAVIDAEYVQISVPHLESYHKLLEDVGAVVSDTEIADLAACLARAMEVEADFADIFTEFEQGNFECAKEFIISDTYQQTRDSFLNEESGYWEGAGSIPINREQMVIHKTENGFRFSFPGYNDYENGKGVITVWGSRQLDDGVQRTSISYEPENVTGAEYPHTEYVITYEYSNVSKNGTDVQMNYRLKTQITTEEGTTTDVIGDWGGEHEWEDTY